MTEIYLFCEYKGLDIKLPFPFTIKKSSELPEEKYSEQMILEPNIKVYERDLDKRTTIGYEFSKLKLKLVYHDKECLTFCGDENILKELTFGWKEYIKNIPVVQPKNDKVKAILPSAVRNSYSDRHNFSFSNKTYFLNHQTSCLNKLSDKELDDMLGFINIIEKCTITNLSSVGECYEPRGFCFDKEGKLHLWYNKDYVFYFA